MDVGRVSTRLVYLSEHYQPPAFVLNGHLLNTQIWFSRQRNLPTREVSRPLGSPSVRQCCKRRNQVRSRYNTRDDYECQFAFSQSESFRRTCSSYRANWQTTHHFAPLLTRHLQHRPTSIHGVQRNQPNRVSTARPSLRPMGMCVCVCWLRMMTSWIANDRSRATPARVLLRTGGPAGVGSDRPRTSRSCRSPTRQRPDPCPRPAA